jgi:hypothetical protein
MNVVDRLAMNLPHLLGNYEKYSKAEEITKRPSDFQWTVVANLRVPRNAQ